MTDNNKHAKYSPSTLSRLITCPASAMMIETHGKNETSSYADEGTMLHEVVHYCMLNGLSAKEYREGSLTKEQEVLVEDCIHYFDDVIDFIPENHLVSYEVKTDLNYIGLPDCGGTADVRIRTPERVDIIDWKFGGGVEVSPIQNVQLMAYAAGSFSSVEQLISCPLIVLHVGQPRMEAFTSWSLTGENLYDWVTYTLKPAIELAESDNPPFVPGVEQCRWCAGPACKARGEMVTDRAVDTFKKYAVKPHLLSNEQLSEMLTKAFFVEQYVKDLKNYALGRALSSQGFPGYKVVNGRSNRKWVDEEEAGRWLIDQGYTEVELYTEKLKSCAQIEKLDGTLKKDPEFQALIYKPPGKPTLVHEDDPRLEYKPASASDAFKNYIEKD